jgi:hypothetical protein
MLTMPGAVDLLTELGFQHLQVASSSGTAPLPGFYDLPMQFPGAREPLFHGALSLLRPAIDNAAASSAEQTLKAVPASPPAAPSALATEQGPRRTCIGNSRCA